MLSRRQAISSSVLIRRTCSSSCWQSVTVQPARSRAMACKCPQRSKPTFFDPRPYWRTRSAISAANGPAVSASRPAHGGPDDLRVACLLNRFQAGRHVRALRILEQNDRAFDGHEEVSRGVAQKVAEHVSRAGRVALIVRIEQQQCGVFIFTHHVANAGETIGAQLARIHAAGLGIGDPQAGTCVRMALVRAHGACGCRRWRRLDAGSVVHRWVPWW